MLHCDLRVRWKVASDSCDFELRFLSPKPLHSAGFLAIWLRERGNRWLLQLCDFGALRLSEFSLPKQHSRNSIPPIPRELCTSSRATEPKQQTKIMSADLGLPPIPEEQDKVLSGALAGIGGEPHFLWLCGSN